MFKNDKIHNQHDIEFRVIYSRRRTIGISVHPDSTVIVRVPYLTSLRTINRIVRQKADWIIRHRDNYKMKTQKSPEEIYVNGATHLFRGHEALLKIEKSIKPYIKFNGATIELGLNKIDDPAAIKKLVYKGYKDEALIVFPGMFNSALAKFESQKFKPTGLIIRNMKRRWGSCSNKGIITLNTELIKLPDLYTEYVIIHELCHLKHHNHGAEYYKLLSALFPDWKKVRKELRRHTYH